MGRSLAVGCWGQRRRQRTVQRTVASVRNEGPNERPNEWYQNVRLDGRKCKGVNVRITSKNTGFGPFVGAFVGPFVRPFVRPFVAHSLDRSLERSFGPGGSVRGAVRWSLRCRSLGFANERSNERTPSDRHTHQRTLQQHFWSWCLHALEKLSGAKKSASQARAT